MTYGLPSKDWDRGCRVREARGKSALRASAAPRVGARGFTLIEIMVVVGILGILASFALPVYHDYAVRTKVAEGLQVSSAAKLAVAETWLSNGVAPITNTDAGLPAPDKLSGNYVQSVAVGANGVIKITFSQDPIINGRTLFLTPTRGKGAIMWNCSSQSIASRHLPSQCRS